MPFTLAHPAAVLPLVRSPFDGLALVCGAMAPDVAYLIRSTPLEVTAQSWYEPFANATTTHSLAGLVPTTLLLALGLYLMLRAAERPALWLAHGKWEAAIAVPRTTGGAVSFRAGRWVWVPISLLIGALTHLVWDSLTSSGGSLATHFDRLNQTAVADMTWIRLSQHASTLIGLAVLAVVVWGRRRTVVSEDAGARRRMFWAVAGFVMVGLAAAVVSVLSRFDPEASPSTRDKVENLLSVAVKGAGAAVAMALLVATVCWWLSLLRIRRTTALVPVD